MNIPGHTLLTRYVQRLTLRAFLLVAAALTGLFGLLDFVEQLALVGQGRYHVADAFLYVLLNAPARLLDIAPVAMLVATLVALGTLAGNSEFAAIQSLGVSARRVIRAVLELVVPLAAILFLIAQFVVPPAEQAAQAERTASLSTSLSFHPENSLWAQSGLQYLNVQSFARHDIPIGVDIYAFTPDGSLATLTHADRAAIDKDGTWLLQGVTRKTAHEAVFRTDHLDTLPWHSFLAARQVRFLFLPIDAMPPVSLYGYLRDLARRHQSAPQYERAFWSKAAIPFSMIALVMVAAPLAFGPPRSQNAGRNIALGLAIGIAFSLAQQIIGHLGLLLNLDPAAAALAPSLAVMIIAVTRFRDAYGLTPTEPLPTA